MLSLASSPVERYCTPVGRIPSVRLGATKEEAYRIARRQRTSTILVTEPHGRRIVGYVRILDLRLEPGETVRMSRQLLEIQRSESPISTLMRMQNDQEQVARVVDEHAQTVGVIDSRVLLDSLLRRTESQVL
jgi:CBS domain containing-hemolysin-like protein